MLTKVHPQATLLTVHHPLGQPPQISRKQPAPRPSSPIPGRWTGKTGTAVSLALLPRMQGATAYTVRPVGPAGRRMEGFTVTGGNIVGTAPAPGKYVLMVFGTIRGQQQFQMAFFDVTP